AQSRLRRGPQRAHAVRLRPRDLGALDRAGDAAPARRARDRHEPVLPLVAFGILEEAVTENAVFVEGDEVRLRRVRVEAPRSPRFEVVEPGLRPPRLVAVRLARDREKLRRQIRTFGEGDERKRRWTGVGRR